MHTTRLTRFAPGLLVLMLALGTAASMPVIAQAPNEAGPNSHGELAAPQPAAATRPPGPQPKAAAPSPSPDAARAPVRGLASWYGKPLHGRPTASGETYDMHALTAAHPSLPFGTWVEVRSLSDGRTVRVRINDRGPYAGRRVIDLSRAAAARIGLVGLGIKRVELRVLDPEEAAAARLDLAAGEPADSK
ncbi:septal ring lytic transglycosylase RlpA family protein [Ramlibacter sp. AN1015]|uniref:septal ring lytic transglycosylase RlpA family protein n=1 Tax=Ramlibacter sp. AN1015 TaxID=3133428 RepID=UPI0030BB1DC7